MPINNNHKLLGINYENFVFFIKDSTLDGYHNGNEVLINLTANSLI